VSVQQSAISYQLWMIDASTRQESGRSRPPSRRPSEANG
jgi:hypothetical protein